VTYLSAGSVAMITLIAQLLWRAFLQVLLPWSLSLRSYCDVPFCRYCCHDHSHCAATETFLSAGTVRHYLSQWAATIKCLSVDTASLHRFHCAATETCLPVHVSFHHSHCTANVTRLSVAPLGITFIAQLFLRHLSVATARYHFQRDIVGCLSADIERNFERSGHKTLLEFSTYKRNKL